MMDQRYQSDSVEHYLQTSSYDHSEAEDEDRLQQSPMTDSKYQHRSWSYMIRHEVDWHSLINMSTVHLLALWGVYRALVYGYRSYYTILFTYVLAALTGIGSLAGAHRYFSHRAFKAHWTFKLFLLFCQTTSGQRSVVRWAREHRTHHRFAGTDADCVNINRGFFFAHIGWLFLKPLPECARRMEECNVSDLTSDRLIWLQYVYYTPLMITCNALLPTAVTWLCFGEDLLNAFLWVFALRYVYTLHIAFSGNSVLHYFGSRPYDRRSTATHCTWMIWATLGAAYHNFHHTFPYDYTASEFGPATVFNLNTVLIDLAAKLGLATDLKRASPATIDQWKRKYGSPEEAVPTRGPALDWTLGMLFSALPIWLILGGRAVMVSCFQ